MSRIDDLEDRIRKLERNSVQFCPKCNHSTVQECILGGYFKCTVCGSNLKTGLIEVKHETNKCNKS